MQQMHWNLHQIRCCEKEIGQAMLSDEHSLVSYTKDFGKLAQAQPFAVCIPENLDKLQGLLNFANQNSLPLTIRGHGLSQGGQSLPVDAGVTVHLQKFNQVHDHEESVIWIDGNASWAQLLKITLGKAQIPYVLPYNCNLSVGGVLSAGGVGASSFRFGTVSSHVEALEVMTVNGELQQLNPQSDLFQACLSGQGRFGVISKACIRLRPCLSQVRTFFLMYHDQNQWLQDIEMAREQADFIETFCSPSIQGSKLNQGKRSPFAQWLFALHITKEYDKTPPSLKDLGGALKPWKVLHTQDESIESYLHRHDSRFEAMKMLGQWELAHPWYECFISAQVLTEQLERLLAELPLHYVPILQIVPMAPRSPTGFLMLPKDKEVYAMMILNPGVHSKLIPSCLQTITFLDELLLARDGKRYLSGYLGDNLNQNYWQKHFGSHYQEWTKLKQKYDPRNILRSQLHPG